jgi:hypothetical protein
MPSAVPPYNPWLMEVFKAVLVVTGTVIIGQAIVASWQMRNKRRELEIASALVLQQMYGEFKDIWRAWKIVKNAPRYGLTPPGDPRFDLLKRATAAESKVEALVVKLAVERNLSDDEIEAVGLFRQGYQQLRQRIRDDQAMDYNFADPEYRLFNDVATRFAGIILADPPRKRPKAATAARQLETIAKFRRKHWRNAKATYAPYTREDTDDEDEPPASEAHSAETAAPRR